MPGTTANHGLRYPEVTDDVLPGSAHFVNLAEDVDDALSAIAPSQIVNQDPGELLIANASGVITGTAVSGDITISNTGVAEIGTGKVGTPEVADLAVTTGKIDNGAVTAGKLATNAVETAKINANAVTTAKIADDAVTAAKLDLTYSSVVLGSDSSVIGTSKTTVLSTASMAAGIYLVVVSGYVQMTKNELGVVRLENSGQLCECRILADSSGVDVYIPISLSWAGTLAGTDTFDVTLQTAAGIIALKQGSRISAVRIG